MAAELIFWRMAEGPIRYGVNDCATTVAAVILDAGGPDLMAGLRGRYSSARGFRRMLKSMGVTSVADLARSILARNGAPADAPRDLDVGVCRYVDGERVRVAPAVRLGGFWMVRTDRGGAALVDGVTEFWRVINA